MDSRLEKPFYVACAGLGIWGALFFIGLALPQSREARSVYVDPEIVDAYDYYTLLVPRADGNDIFLGKSQYDTRRLDCWVRQLLNHGVSRNKLHVLSAGNASTWNLEGEAAAKKHGIDIVRRPIIDSEHTVDRFRYQYSKLWLFNQTGFWVYMDTDLVFHKTPALCAAQCKSALAADGTRLCAVPDNFMPIVPQTYWRWGKNRYWNAGFFAAYGSPELFDAIMDKYSEFDGSFHYFAEQAFLNNFFERSSPASGACNYRREFYEVSPKRPDELVVQHGKYGDDPNVPVPSVCRDLYPPTEPPARDI